MVGGNGKTTPNMTAARMPLKTISITSTKQIFLGNKNIQGMQ